eukprot:2104356-Pyramimonas_sp.AAC.1
MTRQSLRGAPWRMRSTTSIRSRSARRSTNSSGKWARPHGHVPDGKWRPWDLEPGGQGLETVSWNAAAPLYAVTADGGA